MIEKRAALSVVDPSASPAIAGPITLPSLAIVVSRPAELTAIGEAPLDRPQAPPGVVYIPTEDVLMLTVPLPVMSVAQRRLSVAYAVEDRIAQPLDEVHVVLGPEIAAAKGTWLVAVISHDALTARLPQAGREPMPRLLPDVLALPQPATGWSVWTNPQRALVRQADGTGFAVPLDLLPAFWRMSGEPLVTLFGGALPASIPASANAVLPIHPDSAMAGFDLLSGRQDGRRPMLPRGAKGLAVVVAVTLVAHLALLIVDVAALGRIAQSQDVVLRDALSAAGRPIDGDLDAAVSDLLAARQPPATDGFLRLMQRIFTAMASEAGRVTLQTLRYAGTDDQATMTIEAPDIETLQALEQAFGEAGLVVSAGAATSGDGAAQVDMTLGGDGT